MGVDMSTKIYAAYQWKGRNGIRGVLDHLSTTVHGKVLDRAVKNLAGSIEVLHAFHGGIVDIGGVTEFQLFEKKFVEILSGTRRDSLNFSSAVSVFPDTDGKVYAVFNSLDSFSFGNDCPECFIDSRLWSDFHYQNSTDCPSNIKKKDWEHRRKTWEKLFKRCGPDAHTFAHASFTYDFISPATADIVLRRAYEIIRRTAPQTLVKK